VNTPLLNAAERAIVPEVTTVVYDDNVAHEAPPFVDRSIYIPSFEASTPV
jgi:hypothetical protein